MCPASQEWCAWVRGRFTPRGAKRMLESKAVRDGDSTAISLLVQETLEEEATAFLEGAGSTDETRITSTAVPVFR